MKLLIKIKIIYKNIKHIFLEIRFAFEFRCQKLDLVIRVEWSLFQKFIWDKFWNFHEQKTLYRVTYFLFYYWGLNFTPLKNSKFILSKSTFWTENGGFEQCGTVLLYCSVENLNFSKWKMELILERLMLSTLIMKQSMKYSVRFYCLEFHHTGAKVKFWSKKFHFDENLSKH